VDEQWVYVIREKEMGLLKSIRNLFELSKQADRMVRANVRLADRVALERSQSQKLDAQLASVRAKVYSQTGAALHDVLEKEKAIQKEIQELDIQSHLPKP
jgi:hypothetical protein